MKLNFWSILGIVMALATVIFSVRTFLFSYIFAPALRDETLDAKSTKKTKAQIEGKRAWFARMRFMRASRRLSGQVVRMVVGTNKNSTTTLRSTTLLGRAAHQFSNCFLNA